MGEVGTWTAEAKRAASDPAASLSAFALTAIVPDAGPEHLSWVNFGVRCKSCGRDEFAVSYFPLVVPDPSPFYGLAPGDIFRRPPHRLRCSHCGSAEAIFDARTDGYDAIICGDSSYQSGVEGEEFDTGPFKVVVTAAYNIEASELDEVAASAAREIKAADLFDWLTITATPTRGGSPLEFSYECA
jgi:hypothetical protein